MIKKLDLKDRKLLYELDRNARASYAELGKKVGLSKQVARYRVNALEEGGVINKYFTIIDVSRLGWWHTKAFVKLHNASEEEEKELVDWLNGYEHCVWSVSCDGQFDISFGLRASSVKQYAERLAAVENRFGHLFLQKQIAPIVKGEYFYRDYLVGKEAGTEREQAFGSIPAPLEIDDSDWGILTRLGENAREPVTDIAKKIGLSPDAVSKRIKRLEKAGIIQNYVLVLNNAELGQLHFKVLVRLRGVTDRRYKQLVEYCRLHPNVFYIVRTFGPWEFEIDMEVQSVEAFRGLMREVKQKFADTIADFSYINIYNVNKYNFCPSKPKSTEL